MGKEKDKEKNKDKEQKKVKKVSKQEKQEKQEEKVKQVEIVEEDNEDELDKNQQNQEDEEDCEDNNQEINRNNKEEDYESEVEEDESQEKLKVKMLKNLKYDFASYEIKYIYETYLRNDGEINLSPSYQREFAWSNDKQDLFIDSIVNNYIIPPIILIKLNDKKEYRYECMDGQHRLTVLKHYIEGKPINTNDPHYIRYNKVENNKKMNIFYTKKKRLDNIKDTRYMTEDEKSAFNDKKIIIIKISNYDPKLTDLFSYIKNEMFLRLQKGEKVCGTDILRNCSHPLISSLKELNLINCKTYTEDDEENENGEDGQDNKNKHSFNKIQNIMVVKTKKTAQLLTEYLFFILRSLLVIKNKTLDIGNLTEIKIREDILQSKTDRYNLTDGNWRKLIDSLDLFIKDLTEEFKEEDNKLSQYFILILLYLYLTDKTKYNKIKSSLNKYSKFTDEFFRKHFTVKIDGKVSKNYTGKRLSTVVSQIVNI